MKSKMVILMFVLVILSYILYQYKADRTKTKAANHETMTITGTVTDKESGETISKASIFLQGSNIQVFTNGNGEYAIPAKEGDELYISHPKYKKQSAIIEGGKRDFQLVLKDDSIEEQAKKDFPDIKIDE